MIHAVDAEGNVSYHCISNPTCAYHNCAAWTDTSCPHPAHSDRSQAPTGKTITVHVSHSELFWSPFAADCVILPACPGCGSRMTVRIHSDAEKQPPRIHSDALTGEILQVSWPDGANPNLTRLNAEIVKQTALHEAFQQLPPEQLKVVMQHAQQMASQGIDTSWMMHETLVTKIHAVVFPRPHVLEHEKLAAALRAIGKHPIASVEI